MVSWRTFNIYGNIQLCKWFFIEETFILEYLNIYTNKNGSFENISLKVFNGENQHVLYMASLQKKCCLFI